MQPLEPVGHVLGQPHVPIVAAQPHVAVGGERVNLARRQPQQRGVEGAAAQVVDEQRHLRFRRLAGRQIAEHLAERQGGGGRLVDDVQHLEPGHRPGVGRGLPPRLVEVGRHGNHHGIDPPQRPQDVAAQLPQDAGLNHLRRQPLAVDRVAVIVVAHVALDPLRNGVGLDDRRLSGLLAHDDFLVGEEHDARRERLALGVGDDRGFPASSTQATAEKVVPKSIPRGR